MLNAVAGKVLGLTGLGADQLVYWAGMFSLTAVLLLVTVRSFKISRGQGVKLSLQEAQLALQREAMEAHAMVNISDQQGRIIYVNQKFLDQTGFGADELMGKKITQFLLDKDATDPAVIRAVLRKGVSWTGENRMVRKDGKPFWTRTTIVPMMGKKGEVIETISLRTDISETKARQAEAQSWTILERLRDEVYVFTTDTLQLLYLNRQARKFQGWSEIEYRKKGLKDTEENFDEAVFRSHVQPLLSGEMDSLTYESVHNGVPVEINLQMEFCNEGQPRFIAVVRDVMRRKQAEESKAEFVATVSHELRSPLTSVNGALRLITSGAFGKLPEKPAAMLDVAARNVSRLILLINDILDLEKLDAGKMDFQMEEIDVSGLVEEAIAANAGYGEPFQVSFRAIGTGQPVMTYANRDRLMQVMTNLMSNAVKFSHRGGVVDIELRDAPDRVRIFVTDRGIGIPVAAQAHLFERFTQAHGSSDAGRKGTGLGLSIVKSIVEKHGGTIRFTSEANVGTTFCFDLPKAGLAQLAA